MLLEDAVPLLPASMLPSSEDNSGATEVFRLKGLSSVAGRSRQMVHSSRADIRSLPSMQSHRKQAGEGEVFVVVVVDDDDDEDDNDDCCCDEDEPVCSSTAATRRLAKIRRLAFFSTRWPKTAPFVSRASAWQVSRCGRMCPRSQLEMESREEDDEDEDEDDDDDEDKDEDDDDV